MENFIPNNFSIRNDNLEFYQYRHEQKAWQNKSLIYGIDEAGRGCLAGPVVVGAVALKMHQTHPLLQDSKKLSTKQLLLAYSWLLEHSWFTIGIYNAPIIDHYNIYNATKKLMIKTVNHLHALIKRYEIQEILVDAMPLSSFQLPNNLICTSYIKGESESASIAAASIIAKVSRDSIINRMAPSFPLYNFHDNKGYGTALHTTILQTKGQSIIHRSSYISNFINYDQKQHQQSLFC